MASAPARRAAAAAASTKGVVPLAATAITTSAGPGAAAVIRAAPAAASSSAPSTERVRATSPPAMRKTQRSRGQEKVGVSSAPSWVPRRPDVPAPT